jgi:hypothetical protein
LKDCPVERTFFVFFITQFHETLSCVYITHFFQGLSYGRDISTYEVMVLQEVQDESDGCGAKFSVLIVSDKFEGKPLLQRHRYKF